MDVFLRIEMLVLFAVAATCITLVLVRAISEKIRNDRAPRETKAASVVAKRSHTRVHDEGSSVTRYYVTFQFDDGSRLELRVPSRRFGYFVEGDRGQLTSQGTRFLEFSRT